MKENIDRVILLNKRQSKAWTQNHLAEISGLSLRTIQRIEKTGKASYESIKSLASVYNIEAQDLMLTDDPIGTAINSSQSIKGKSLAKIGLLFSYVVVIALFYALIKLIFLYIEVSSGQAGPKTMSGGISQALVVPLVSMMISYVGYIIFVLPTFLYDYNNRYYNKLMIIPVVTLLILSPLMTSLVVIAFLLLKKTKSKKFRLDVINTAVHQ